MSRFKNYPAGIHFCYLCLCWISVWGFSVPLQAQQDTIYTLPEQIIRDSGIVAFRVQSHYSLYQKDSTGSFGVAGVSADAVLRQAEGVYIRNYGGHGGIKTVSFRGFATNQTTVSIMDIPYQSPQSSVVDFSSFYLSAYDGIEIYRTGESGSQNPGGGNINLKVRPPQKKQTFFGGIGSFGEISAGIESGFVVRKLHSSVMFQVLKSEDSYPFRINGEQNLRQNAGFQTQRFQVNNQYKLKEGWNLTYFLTGHNSSQGIPGPILTGLPLNPGDSLNQKDIFHFLRVEHSPPKFKSLWLPFRYQWSLSHHWNNMAVTVNGLEARYRNHDVMLQAQAKHLFHRQSLTFVFQINPSFLTGDNLAINFQPVQSVQRTLWNAGIQHAILTGVATNDVYPLQIHTTLRLNYSRDYSLLPNGVLLINWNPVKGNPNRKMNFSIQYGNRLPSFNELYYFGYGNSGLNPEKALSGEGGIYLKSGRKRPFTFKWNFFINYTQDKIIAVPLNPVQWSTMSIGLTRTAGAEYVFEYYPSRNQFLYLNYTLQKATDETREEKPLLPYTPRELLNYGYKFNFKSFNLFINGNYCGWRYSLLKNGEESLMHSYNLIDAGLGYRLKVKTWEYTLDLTTSNLLNSQYAIIRSYPMPGRAFSAKISVVWH